MRIEAENLRALSSEKRVSGNADGGGSSSAFGPGRACVGGTVTDESSVRGDGSVEEGRGGRGGGTDEFGAAVFGLGGSEGGGGDNSVAGSSCLDGAEINSIGLGFRGIVGTAPDVGTIGISCFDGGEKLVDSLLEASSGVLEVVSNGAFSGGLELTISAIVCLISSNSLRGGLMSLYAGSSSLISSSGDRVGLVGLVGLPILGPNNTSSSFHLSCDGS